MFHSDKITDTEKVGGFKVCHTEGKCRADRKLGMGKAPLSTFREISKTLKKTEAVQCGRIEPAGYRISISIQNIKKAEAVNCFVTNIQHQGINTAGMGEDVSAFVSESSYIRL